MRSTKVFSQVRGEGAIAGNGFPLFLPNSLPPLRTKRKKKKKQGKWNEREHVGRKIDWCWRSGLLLWVGCSSVRELCFGVFFFVTQNIQVQCNVTTPKHCLFINHVFFLKMDNEAQHYSYLVLIFFYLHHGCSFCQQIVTAPKWFLSFHFKCVVRVVFSSLEANLDYDAGTWGLPTPQIICPKWHFWYWSANPIAR